MSDTTVLLEGVSRHGSGFRVRVRFGDYRHDETLPDPDAANARALELRQLRKLGLLPASAPTDPLIKDVVAALLLKKETRRSKKTGRMLRPTSVTWWNGIVKPWRDLYGELPVSRLRRDIVDAYLGETALEHVHAANNHLTGLKALLRVAEAGGANVDRTIFALEPLPHIARERVALAAFDVQFFCARAPEHGRRQLLFAATVGARWSELVTLAEKRFDPAAKTMVVPAGLCKEAVDKTIDLTAAEVQLVREQLLARAPGAKTVFCSATGLTWHGHYGDWWREVWQKTVIRAARDWREINGLPDDADTPFLWRLRDDSDEPVVDDDGCAVFGHLQGHDLRASAITMMRDAGFTKEQTAARVGHADSSRMIDRIYDKGDKRKRAGVRKAIDELAPDGLLEAM